MMICEVNMMIEPCIQALVYSSLQNYAKQATDHSGALYSRIQRNQDLQQQITLYFAFEDHFALQLFLKAYPCCLPQDMMQQFGSQVAANRRVFEVAEEYVA